MIKVKKQNVNRYKIDTKNYLCTIKPDNNESNKSFVALRGS